jgi:alpha/beta superfamily hydrolase
VPAAQRQRTARPELQHGRQRLDIVRSLAVALAAAGVATLRYDKRGSGESTGDYLTAGFDDEAADAGAAIAPRRPVMLP